MNQVESAPSNQTPKYSCRQNVNLSTRAAVFAFMTVLNSACAANAAQNASVQPAHLVVAAKINESVLLRLEVTTTNPAAGIDLKADGLRIQREIQNVDPTHHVFLIEPDTSQKGRVNGQIEVMDKTGSVLCVVPVTGEVQPYIRVSPSRLFLGSLEYGTQSDHSLEYRIQLSADTAWEFLGIDASEIPDARWEIKNEDAETKVLLLRFSENVFKANKPYGAFIRRTICLKTNNPAQPEISFVIEGMLSRNATKRNFNTFVFKGNERWQGKWGTPNLAAAVLGPIVLLVLGYGVWLMHVRIRHPLLWRIVAVSLCLCAIVGMLLLARTYSRGGWLAFGVGLGLMVALMRRHRSVLCMGAVVFILIVVFLPAGMQRAVSASAIGEDLSISHRLLVWRGASEMIADHPIYGVGDGQFGPVFQTYYQEPWHKEQYVTAISDYLTFAAERGMFGVVVVVGAAVCLAVAAVGYSRRCDDVWLVPVIGVLLTLGTSSIFSSIEFVREVRWLSEIGIGVLAVYCGLRFVQERRRQRDAGHALGGKIWLPAVGAGLAVGGLLVGAVMAVAWMRPARCLTPTDVSGRTTLGTLIEYLPGRKVTLKGTLLFLPTSPEPLSTVGKQILRPLAENGWHAVALDLPMYDQEAAGQVAAALRGLAGPTVVLAEGTRARVAIMAAQLLGSPNRPKLIFVNPVFSSALGECDQSSAQGIASDAAVITGERWQAFKRDGRSGLNTIIQLCDASVRRSSTSAPDGSLTGAPQLSGSAVVPVSATGL